MPSLAHLYPAHLRNMKITLSQIKEFLKSFTVFVVLASLALGLSQLASAQGVSDIIRDIGEPTDLPSFEAGGHADASIEPGAAGITSALLFTVDLFKYILATVAVVVIIASGIRLITAGKQIEEVSSQQKENIKYAGIGLIVIFMADELIRQVLFGESGEVFRSEADIQLAAERGVEQIRGLYNFLQFFVGAIAVFMIVFSGVRLIASAGNDEAITKTKKQLQWAIVGLILVGISELLVKRIIFPDAGASLPDVQAARALIRDITNFASSFIATVAIAFLMYGGVLYVTAAGREEQTTKAKKVVLGAIIGIFVALAAFALVNTFIQFDPQLDTADFGGDVTLSPVSP